MSKATTKAKAAAKTPKAPRTTKASKPAGAKAAPSKLAGGVEKVTTKPKGGQGKAGRASRAR